MNTKNRLRRTPWILLTVALITFLGTHAHAAGKKSKTEVLAAAVKQPFTGEARYTLSFPSDTWGEAFFDVYTTTVTASELLGHFYLQGRRASLNGVNVFTEQALADIKVKVSSEIYKEAERFVEESSRYAKLMGPCEAEASEFYQMDALPDDNPRKAWLKKKIAPCREQSEKYFSGYKSFGSNENLKKLGVVLRMREREVDPAND